MVLIDFPLANVGHKNVNIKALRKRTKMSFLYQLAILQETFRYMAEDSIFCGQSRVRMDKTKAERTGETRREEVEQKASKHQRRLMTPTEGEGERRAEKGR